MHFQRDAVWFSLSKTYKIVSQTKYFANENIKAVLVDRGRSMYSNQPRDDVFSLEGGSSVTHLVSSVYCTKSTCSNLAYCGRWPCVSICSATISDCWYIAIWRAVGTAPLSLTQMSILTKVKYAYHVFHYTKTNVYCLFPGLAHLLLINPLQKQLVRKA